MMELMHRGSVKDIYKITPAGMGELSVAELNQAPLLFRFSDRYSIFDWGQMPDAIPGKGAALALMGRKLLQHLEECGFSTHFLKPGPLATDLVVRSVEVPRTNVGIYQTKPVAMLVPLEVIYRFGAPQGSSLLRKFKSGADWQTAGYDRAYQEGEDFAQVHLDVTTKLERLDRALNATEAKALAGMSDEEWDELVAFTKAIAEELKNLFARGGMKLWDGKLEFAFVRKPNGKRGFILVDSIGLDEIRLTWKGRPLSKELLRQAYISSPWFTALTDAKKQAPDDFRTFCEVTLRQSPLPLPPKTLLAISKLYQSVADLILNENAAEVQTLQTLIDESLEALCASS